MKLTIRTANTFDTHTLTNDFLTENDAILLADVAMTLVNDHIEEGYMTGGITYDELEPRVQFLDDNDQPLPFTYDMLIKHVNAHGGAFTTDGYGTIITRIHGECYNPDKHAIALPINKGGVHHV